MGSRATSAWVGLVNARQEVSVVDRKASAGPDRRRPRTLGAHLVDRVLAEVPEYAIVHLESAAHDPHRPQAHVAQQDPLARSNRT